MTRYNFEPKPFNPKKRKRVTILLVVFFILLASITYWWLNQDDNDISLVSDLPTICGFDTDKTKETLQGIKMTQKQVLKDYFYYGETLTLLADEYVLGQRDALMGSLVTLHNLCDNNLYTFLLSDSLDGNIPVEELEPGFYVASVEDGLNKQYLISYEVIHDTFTTITRENVRHQIRLIADEDYFVDTTTDNQLFLDKPLFIEVTEVSKNSEIADIVIDPAYLDQDFGRLDDGYTEGDFNSANQTYQFATAIQKKLESHGLVVELTRKADEVMNTYGNPSRVYKAYDTKAKLMVEIAMEPQNDPRNFGFAVTGSSYALLSLPEMVSTSLKETNLPVRSIGKYSGAFYNRRLNGLDYHNLIRESGGYSLGATQYSEISARLNEFAKDNRHGTQTISIDYGNVSDPLVRESLINDFDVIVDATVNGILTYLGLN